MNAFKKRVHPFGFTLIEVMIAMGVASVIMYGLMTMTQNSQKAQVSVASNIEINDYVSLMEMQLSNPATCKSILASGSNTFSPANLGQTTVVLSQLLPLPAGVTLQPPASGNSANVTLINPSTIVPATPNSIWAGQISLTFNKNASKSVGGSLITRKLAVNLVTTPWTSGNSPLSIVNCGMGATGGGLTQPPQVLGSGVHQTTPSDCMGNMGIGNSFCQNVTFVPGWSPSKVIISGNVSYATSAIAHGASDHGYSLFYYGLDTTGGTVTVCFDSNGGVSGCLGSEIFSYQILGMP